MFCCSCLAASQLGIIRPVLYPVRAQSGDEKAGQLSPSDGVVTVVSNTAPISIPDSGPGAPYPSTITVSNLPTQIAKITVKLNGLSHTFPSDIDVLLVGPGGQNAVIMSDVGGSDDVNGITLTLDDTAPLPLPNSLLMTGTFQPTNITAGDPFPAPAPAPSGGSALTVFNGTNPNGTWSLYIVDDAAIDLGSLAGGWTLTITGAFSGQNTGAISIPAIGAASPYPSGIDITNHNDPIYHLQVNVFNFSHDSPDDVDLLLVSPTGRKVVLMSDVGGNTPVSNVNLIFDDRASNSLPDNGPLISGIFRPTNFDPGDIFPAPAPADGLEGRLLSSMNGSGANGPWKLFIVDDAGNNVGSVAGGWGITIEMATGMIFIPENGPSAPYPAEVTVSGLPGSITKATVTLSNFSHLAPDDVDIMLVGPSGRRIVLMSDAGGNTEVGGLTLTFDDQAAATLPDSAPLVSGTYKPTDFETGDVFPSPAPAGPLTGTSLNAFYGGPPNGIWRLYIVDDNGTNFGSLAGNWTVNLQTSISACLFTVSPTTQAFPVSGGSGSFSITMPTGCSWTASPGSGFLSLTSPAAGDGNGSLSFSVAQNMGNARTGTIDVTNGVTTRSFQVQQPSGCPSALSQTVVNFNAGGGTGNVSVTAGGVCSWQAATTAGWIHVTSGQQTGNGSVSFTVDPNSGSLPRTTTVTAGAQTLTVNQTAVRTARFDFDGDAKSDISLFRPGTGSWWILNSGQAGSYTTVPFGVSSDRITPADFDGDRKTDIAVYRDGTWYVFQSQTSSVRVSSWGVASDVPVPGDYDGDGKAELAVYRPTGGGWWILKESGAYTFSQFGQSGDAPVPADYDGDGKADLSVYRPGTTPGAQGTWYFLRSTTGFSSQLTFGVFGDLPVPADYDGDGLDNVAIYRPSTGVWYRSVNPNTNYDAIALGAAGDRPAPADYDGDGKADVAVFRQGTWYLLSAGSGVLSVIPWGVTTDRPAPSAFIP